MRKKKLFIISGIGLLCFLLILIVVLVLFSKWSNRSQAEEKESASNEVTISNDGAVAENDDSIAERITEDSDGKQIQITMEITPMAREILGSWSYLLVEGVNNYAAENQIKAKCAEIIAYGGLDEEGSYLFYVKLDTAEETILEMRYKDYKVTTKRTSQTLDEILENNYDSSDDAKDSRKAHEALEKQWEAEDGNAATQETPIPTSSPTAVPVPEMPNSSIQILDVPTDLVDQFKNPASFASTLAGYLSTIDQDPNQDVYYADGLIENTSIISFLIKCEDGTLISVEYTLKTDTFNYSIN